MEVFVKIKEVNIKQSFDYIELVSKDKTVPIEDVFTVSIHSLHDVLFGDYKLLIKSKVFSWSTIIGIVFIKNLIFNSLNKIELSLPIRDPSYYNKLEYYNLKPLEHIGTITLEFEVVKMNKEEAKEYANGFVKKIFDFFISPKKLYLFKNLKSILDETARGSNICRFKMIYGGLLIDSYLCSLHEKNTKNINIQDLSKYKACITKTFENRNLGRAVAVGNEKIKIIKTNKPTRTGGNINGQMYKKSNFDSDYCNGYPLEYFILGETYKMMEISELLRLRKENSKLRIIATKPEDKKNSFFTSFVNFFKMKNEDKKKVESNQNRDIENISDVSNETYDIESEENFFHSCSDSLLNQFYDIFSENQGTEQFNEEFSYRFGENQYNLKKILKPKDLQTYHIEDIMNNDGYSVCGDSLLTGILNLFYYSISSYGNTWPTLFLGGRSKYSENEQIDGYRKAVVELLGIKNKNLLVISRFNQDVPDYIVFYEKENNRIVVSFKGTTTSDETLHDLDCGYGRFYEGFAHNGITNLSSSYVKNKLYELVELCSKYKTKNILFTGHSLGGSISILVNIILLKENKMKDYNICTVAFSAAPVVSYNLAMDPYSKIFVINYGNDLVSRLSFGSVCELKYICCSVGHGRDEFQSQQETREKLYDIKSYSNKENSFHKLYFPGQVYHLKRIYANNENNKISLVLYKKVDSNFYEDVLVIKHAPLHHMPNHIINVLSESIKDFNNLR